MKLVELATGKTIPSEQESQQRLHLIGEINQLELDTDTDHEEMLKHFQVGRISEMTVKQLEECKKILEKKLKK